MTHDAWICVPNAAGAARTVAAVPVAAEDTLELVRKEADEVVCLDPLAAFIAVGVWYRSFDQVDDAAVVRLLDQNRRDRAALKAGRASPCVG